MLKRRFSLDHATKTYDLRIFSDMSLTAKKLPAPIVFVVCYSKDRTSFKNVPAAYGSDVLWIREGPLICGEAVVVIAHIGTRKEKRLTFEMRGLTRLAGASPLD